KRERERGREREKAGDGKRERVMRFNEKWPRGSTRNGHAGQERQSWGVGDLWRMFKGYGMVFDIYMVKKRLKNDMPGICRKSKAETGIQNLRGGVSYRDGRRYIDVLDGMSMVVREANKKGVTVKKINYIERLPEICKTEGLLNVEVKYMGGLDVMVVLELEKTVPKEEIPKHCRMEVDNVNKSDDEEVSYTFNDEDKDDIDDEDDEVVGRRRNRVTLKVVEVAVSHRKIKIIIKQRVKVNQKACILELKRRNHEERCSDNQYAVSIKEDTAYPCPKTSLSIHEERLIRRIQKKSIRRIGLQIMEYNNRGAQAKKPQYAECMTRSSTKYLLTPFEEPKRVLRSCEEEVTEAMREPTMEEYMTKTREDYGSEIARPKIDEKAHFELKDQIMLRIFPVSLTEAATRWLRNKPAGSIDTWETLKKKFLSKYFWKRFKELLLRFPQHYLMDMLEVILFYKGLDVPTRQILGSKGAIPSMKVADVKRAIQDMADHSQKWYNGTSTRTRSTETSDRLVAIQDQLNNLGREIKKVNERVYATQVRCESCNGPHYTKDYPLKEEGKTLEEAYYTQFGVPFP
ncbi:hypothetical protein Tco_0228576, partial [Tanacetum coccineum]